MISRIIPVRVSHKRLFGKEHEFSYQLLGLLVDLDELPRLDKGSKLFGYNRTRFFSIHDADYLREGSGSIRQKLGELLRGKGSSAMDQAARILLLTFPRVLGMVFRPVSFYYLLGQNGTLITAVAEVNNTFGEKHAYVLSGSEGQPEFPARFRAAKDFYVSPFFDLEGEYAFSFSDPVDALDVSVDLIKEGKVAFTARMEQVSPGKALVDNNILLQWLRHPMAANLTFARILRQAGSLYFWKNLSFHSHHRSLSPMTIRTHAPSPGFFQRLTQSIVVKVLQHRIKRGELRITLPRDEPLRIGGAKPGLSVDIAVHDRAFFSALLLRGDIGLGEAYVKKHWSTDDLAGFFNLMLANNAPLAGRQRSSLRNWIRYALKAGVGKTTDANTPSGSKKNIKAHYDLSNDLFASFLDSSMTYSAAIFTDPCNPSEPLEQAQKRKLRLVADKAGLQKGGNVLEIGCGWGSFALLAAQEYGCKVTAVTLSKEQHGYVQALVKKKGLEESITVLLTDYRSLSDTFDAIVSIEMVEAVGHSFHKTYFQTLNRLLAPGGRAVIQAITIVDQRYDAYRRGQDWVNTYIFPGGLLPSLARITEVLARHTGLVVSHSEDIGLHYAATLKLWREEFDRNWPGINRLGYGEETRRRFEYYFELCEAGFRAGEIRDLQLVLEHGRRCSCIGSKL